MNTTQPEGWFPTTAKNSASVANPIRHFFWASAALSACGKVYRPENVSPAKVKDDDSLNCAGCQRKKRKATNA